MRSLLLAFIILFAIAPVGGRIRVAGDRHSAEASTSTAPIRQGASSGPELTAPIAFAADLTNGVELFAQNPDAQAAPASTMKIVTALVARSVLDLSARVTVEPDEVLDPEEFSVMGLQAGDEVSVRDLFYGLLIPSGGDAGLVLARVAGRALDSETKNPTSRFVSELNSWAATHGMTNSQFVNPTGIDDPDQHSSARDLVRAAEQLLNDWFLARIVSSPSASVEVGGPNPRVLDLVSSNQFIGRDDVFGVKTGTEDTAGQCLVGGFWRGDHQIITVVLGSQDRYADTQALLDYVDSQYRWLAVGIGTVSLGASDELASQGLTFMTRRTILMTQDQASQIAWELVLRDEQQGASRRGFVRFLMGPREIARLPVYSK